MLARDIQNNLNAGPVSVKDIHILSCGMTSLFETVISLLIQLKLVELYYF